MRTEIQEKTAMFHAVNDITLRGEIVVFGSTFMANFPFYELSQKYMMTNAVYNRSIEGLTLAEAEEILQECVLEIKPGKVFLALGEKDIGSPSAMAVYSRILRKLKEKLPEAKLYILPVQKDEFSQNDGGRVAFNEKLKELSIRYGVTWLDVPDQPLSLNVLYEKIFKKLNCFFRGNHISFANAFSYAD